MARRGAHPWRPAAPGQPSRYRLPTCACRAASIFPVRIRGCGITGARVRHAAEATATTFNWRTSNGCNLPLPRIPGTTPAMTPKALRWNRSGYASAPSIRPIDGAHDVETCGRAAVRGFVSVGIPFERQKRDHSGRLVRAPVLDHVALEMCFLPDHANLFDGARHAMLRERALEGLQRHRSLDRPGIR